MSQSHRSKLQHPPEAPHNGTAGASGLGCRASGRDSSRKPERWRRMSPTSEEPEGGRGLATSPRSDTARDVWLGILAQVIVEEVVHGQDSQTPS